MSDKDLVRVTFDLGTFGGAFDLAIEEVRPWLEKEAAFWAWIANVTNQTTAPVTGQLRSHLKQLRRNINPNLETAISSPNAATAQALSHAIETQWKAHRVPHSTTVMAKFISDLAATDPEEAVAAAAHLINISPPGTPPPKHFEGTTKAILFELGLSSLDKAATSTHMQLAAEWRKHFAELSRQANEVLQNAQVSLSSQQQNFTNFSENANSQIVQQGSEFTQLKDSWVNEFNAIKTTYDTQLALRAPITYWSRKRKHHKGAAHKFTLSLSAYSIIGFIVLAISANSLLAGELSGLGKIPIWHFLAFTTLVLLFLWGARLIVRLMLSHQHLEADAHERVVMTSTFLALMRAGKLSPESQKELLSALLRHSSDGIVKDDAMPYLSDFIGHRGPQS